LKACFRPARLRNSPPALAGNPSPALVQRRIAFTWHEAGQAVLLSMITPPPLILPPRSWAWPKICRRLVSHFVSIAYVGPARKNGGLARNRYLISTVAPASVNFFLMVSASSLETPSFTFLGAPSTRSLASFKPRLVTSRTALITLILLAPTSLSTTVNSVFSSAGAAPAPAAAPPPAIITGAAAAADTPRRDSSFLTNSAASRSDSP